MVGKTTIGNLPGNQGLKTSRPGRGVGVGRGGRAMSAATRTRRRGGRLTRFQAGLVAIVVIVFGTYLAFAGHLPFLGGGFELKATFDNTSALQLNSPVRIAGVERRQGDEGRAGRRRARPRRR